MAVRTVIQPPHKTLTSVSERVSENDKELRSLLLDLFDTLEDQHDPPGVGLSAPQINVPKRVFLARLNEEQIPVIFVNPEIVVLSDEVTDAKETREYLEGCLSIPGLYGEVIRPVSAELTYVTFDWKQVRRNKLDNWKRVRKQFAHLDGRVVQHEFDHLNGVLFTHHTLAQGGKLYEIQEENGEEILVRVEME